MNQRGQSREQYEDDILAFLMDGMLEEEGWALLEENERLNEDPDAAIPAGLDERCRALLQSAFPDKPMKKPERVTWKILKRVLIAAVLAATMFATACAAVPEFRAGVLNFFTRVEKIGTYFYFYSNEADTPTPTPSSPLRIKDGMPFEFSYVPEGYEIYTCEAFDGGVFGPDYLCIYVDPNNDPNNFIFEINCIDERTGVLVDTEDAQVTEMKIRGYDGYLIEKTHAASGRNIIHYLWLDLENELMFDYTSVGIPSEESQRIFDGIVIYGYEADTPTRTPIPSSPLVIKDGMPFEFSYVPEGYELHNSEAYDAGVLGISYRCVYIDPDNELNNFAFDIEPIDESTGVLLDTENAQVTEMKIRGCDGYLIQKPYSASGGNIISYVWCDLENRLMFNYCSVGFSLEESQRIFDGIVIYE